MLPQWAGCPLLLLLFDRGTNLRRDIGTGPPSYGEQSFRDGACALDDNGFGTGREPGILRTSTTRVTW